MAASAPWTACSIGPNEASNEGSDGATDGATSGSTDATGTRDGRDTANAPIPSQPSQPGLDLPVHHHADPGRAATGRQQLVHEPLAPGFLPRVAFDYLWLVWGTAAPQNASDLWAQAKARWGLVDSPDDPDGPPLGMKVKSGLVSMDCLLCHADRVAGQIVLGAANSRVDIQGIYDDLAALSATAKSFGIQVPEYPFEVHGRTGAAGANDAFGLGIGLSYEYLPPPEALESEFGFQRPAAWWTLPYKHRMYSDGSGAVGQYRPMMATLLAFGLPWQALLDSTKVMSDIGQFALSVEVPAWPFELDPEAVRDRGRDHFDAHCASCHGVHSGPDAAYPDAIISVQDVGTDPLRAERFGAAEAAWISSTWLAGAEPLESTGGYLAQPMAGIWARAPYFHNGSVPDLASVLAPEERPLRWRRVGSAAADYDPVRVGWRYETVKSASSSDTIEGRRVVDTTRPGMSATGHDYGSTLTPTARAELLAYLRSL